MKYVSRPRTGITYRYAQSLLTLLNKNETLDWYKKIDEIIRTLEEIFSDYHYSLLPQNKKEVIIISFAENWSLPFIKPFFSIIIENNRLNMMIQILKAWKELYYLKENSTHIDITTAHQISTKEKKDIESTLHSHYDKYLVNYHYDTQIIGGNIIEVNGKILDSSIKSYLKNIKNSLSETICL